MLLFKFIIRLFPIFIQLLQQQSEYSVKVYRWYFANEQLD